MFFGARGPKLVELYATGVEYGIQWKRPKINLVELAKLRWIEKWSVSRLGKHFERSPETIQMHICQLRAGGLGKLDLEPCLYEQLRKGSRAVFKGR